MFQHTTEVDSLSCSNSSSQMPVNYCHGNSPPSIFDSLDSGGFFPPHKYFQKCFYPLLKHEKKYQYSLHRPWTHHKKKISLTSFYVSSEREHMREKRASSVRQFDSLNVTIILENKQKTDCFCSLVSFSTRQHYITFGCCFVCENTNCSQVMFLGLNKPLKKLEITSTIAKFCQFSSAASALATFLPPKRYFFFPRMHF